MTTEPAHRAARLREAGLRVTAPRVAVLAALEEHPHADADTIAKAARANLGAVSTQAVYDVLRAFTDVGLTRRIEPAGHPARYETRVGDNHHHVVCRQCGTMADVECVTGDQPCLAPAGTGATMAGYVVDEAEVVFWGLCPACRRPT